ncbi:alcohol-forming fatty acyl-CoA reductase, partial [Sarracenia purpurea var. burkii]
MGETLNGVPGLDIELEKKVMEERLNELQIEAASEEEIKMAMKELGIQRFNIFS